MEEIAKLLLLGIRQNRIPAQSVIFLLFIGGIIINFYLSKTNTSPSEGVVFSIDPTPEPYAYLQSPYSASYGNTRPSKGVVCSIDPTTEPYAYQPNPYVVSNINTIPKDKVAFNPGMNTNLDVTANSLNTHSSALKTVTESPQNFAGSEIEELKEETHNTSNIPLENNSTESHFVAHVQYIPSKTLYKQGKGREIRRSYGKEYEITPLGKGNGNWKLFRHSDIKFNGVSIRNFVLDLYHETRLTHKLYRQFMQDYSNGRINASFLPHLTGE